MALDVPKVPDRSARGKRSAAPGLGNPGTETLKERETSPDQATSLNLDFGDPRTGHLSGTSPMSGNPRISV